MQISESMNMLSQPTNILSSTVYGLFTESIESKTTETRTQTQASDDDGDASPTQETVTSDEQGEESCSGFDAASFIGGIVLTGGLACIGFFAVKFCQTRQEEYKSL